MNNKVLVTIIAVLILGVSGYFFINSQRGIEDTDGKPVAQIHRSYQIEVISNTLNIQPKQKTTIKYRIKNDKGEILKNYETVHEKIMHFIVARKDLQNFQHLHPDFNQATGEFTIDITFPTDGTYRVFPDFTPTEDNPQKLPTTVFHDVNVGDISKYISQQVLADTNPTKAVGDYILTYELNPKPPKAQDKFTFTLTVARNGQPVTNLETYLGALGHSVILKEETLDFIHAHAGKMDMNMSQEMNQSKMMMEDMAMGSDINFSTTFPESGVYKIFTQFQHEGKVQTVDYIVKVD